MHLIRKYTETKHLCFQILGSAVLGFIQKPLKYPGLAVIS